MTDWHEITSNSSGYQTEIRENDSGVPAKQRIFVGTASTGNVRIEWVQARFGQIVPTNWSWIQMYQFMTPGSFMPLGYQVDDAQNLICAQAIQGDYEWLLLYEHDMLPAPDVLVRLNEYMKRGDVPVVSALYFTRSHPAEPLIYRKQGSGAFEDFDIGDLVWCDGVPTGMLLIHMGIIKAMWDESEEYSLGSLTLRRVFQTPVVAFFDPETAHYHTTSGTSDLAWCKRVMEGGYLAKAGFPEYQDLEYPFLVDTSIICQHIEATGEQFPPGGARAYWNARREWMKRPLHPELQGAAPEALEVNVVDEIHLGDHFGD